MNPNPPDAPVRALLEKPRKSELFMQHSKNKQQHKLLVELPIEPLQRNSALQTADWKTGQIKN